MSTPVWTTTAGKLASIDEQVSYSLQLEANTSDSTAISYSIIAGSLPSGMSITSSCEPWPEQLSQIEHFH
jgi:hypothetical protein